jgi:glutamyl-tRNA synthetase
MNKPVRVRFAPSPTGLPHVGNIRTALFNWLFARHSQGQFIVRIEDTDVARSVEGAIEAILEGLHWLGLDWDEGPEVGGEYGPYLQSQRLDIYRAIAQQLVKQGDAYLCYCSPQRLEQMRAEQMRRKEPPGYDRLCRNLTAEERAQLESKGNTPVIRFTTPLAGDTGFHDLIRGQVTFDNRNLDDFVLLKSDGYPTYHLANVVDDHLMEISHVLRADEWLASTPRHVLLYKALDYEPPLFAHLPMILGPDRSKLSKRHGAVSVLDYRERGYPPEAVVNFLALLGWSLDDRTELISREQLVRHFSLERIGKTGAIFNIDKLDWMSGVYIRQLPADEFLERVLPFLETGLPQSIKRPISREYVQQMAPLIQERITTFGDAAEYAEFFFIEELDYDPALLSADMTGEAALKALGATNERLQDLDSFDASSLEGVLRPLASELGLKAGEFFGLLRVATTGRTAAPPLFQTMAVLGKERCLKRIKAAAAKLQTVPR